MSNPRLTRGGGARPPAVCDSRPSRVVTSVSVASPWPCSFDLYVRSNIGEAEANLIRDGGSELRLVGGVLSLGLELPITRMPVHNRPNSAGKAGALQAATGRLQNLACNCLNRRLVHVLSEKAHFFLYAPNVVRYASFHRRCHAEGLMDAPEVLVHEV
jgi:hypothetical protein